MTGSGKRTREESWLDKMSSKLELARDDGQKQSTRDSRETSRHERGSRPVKEDRVKMRRHSSSFVEVSLESTHS